MSRIATRERNNGEREQGSLMRKCGRGKRRGGRIGFGIKGVRSVLCKSKKQIDKINETASKFRYFAPFNDIFEEAEGAKSVISLNAQFGEGWLLPAEIVSYARQGVNNVVSLQPFGCIANHIVSRGVEKRIKSFYPDINLLSLDFDSGVSDVNITNRMLLFIDNLKNATMNYDNN